MVHPDPYYYWLCVVQTQRLQNTSLRGGSSNHFLSQQPTATMPDSTLWLGPKGLDARDSEPVLSGILEPEEPTPPRNRLLRLIRGWGGGATSLLGDPFRSFSWL